MYYDPIFPFNPSTISWHLVRAVVLACGSLSLVTGIVLEECQRNRRNREVQLMQRKWPRRRSIGQTSRGPWG